MVGMVVTISPSFSLYRIVVFPAASRPTMSILISFLPNKPLKRVKKFPMVSEEKNGGRGWIKHSNREIALNRSQCVIYYNPNTHRVQLVLLQKKNCSQRVLINGMSQLHIKQATLALSTRPQFASVNVIGRH